MKNGNKVYHICFGDDNHHYFGSIAAIFDTFTPVELGVSKYRLWSFGIKENKPYRNDKCIIYRGLLRRKRTKRHPQKH